MRRSEAEIEALADRFMAEEKQTVARSLEMMVARAAPERGIDTQEVPKLLRSMLIKVLRLWESCHDPSRPESHPEPP
jgi:hypothetical protein